MRIRTQEMRYTGLDTRFTLYYLTDLHLGIRACDEELLRRDIQRIKDDDEAHWIGGGDYIEAINPNDKRFDSAVISDWVDDLEATTQIQAEYAAEMLRPIAHKCLGLLKGNHETTARTWSNYDPYRHIFRELNREAGLPYDEFADESLQMGTGGYIRLRFIRARKGPGSTSAFVIFAHHGDGGHGVGLPGAPALKLGRAMDIHCEADLVLLGHLHVKNHLTKINYHLVNDRLEERERKGFYVPSYLRARIDPRSDRAKLSPAEVYSERKVLPLTPQGTFPIFVTPGRGTLEALV